MMLRKLVLPTALVLSINAYAGDSNIDENWDGAKGLVGVQVGYMGTKYTHTDPTTLEKTTRTTDGASVGLKFGGESKHYRAFAEALVWYTDPYKTALAFGGALQYLIPVNSDVFNIFIGVNAGGINSYQSEFDPYYGGDAGININVSESFGLEFGGRYSAVGTNDDQKVKGFYQGYVTAIFKLDGDY